MGEVGIAGDFWGPLGYSLKLRYTRYTDQFFGRGQKWPCDDNQCGGAAEETYTALYWGVTASF